MKLNPRIVREQILNCRECDLYERCRSPVAYRGPTPSKIAIVGEAPGEQEDQQGTPFVGPSGILLHNALQEAKINPEKIFYCNAVNCFPSGPPPKYAIEACKPNLISQLKLAKARYVILLGNVALRIFKPDCKISVAHGIPWVRDSGVLMFPTYHPSYALRSAAADEDLREDLRFFKLLLESDPEKYPMLTKTYRTIIKEREHAR